MKSRIVVAILFAGILFLAYQLYLNMSRKQGIEEQFESYAEAPVITQPIPEPPRTISPGGPNSPNQMPPEDEEPTERLPGPTESDPGGDMYGSSDIKDNLRYPERLFGPAPQPKITNLAAESGVASMMNAGVNEALQSFRPEFAQNGGEFINGGIFANDTLDEKNYSAF